MTLLPVVGQPLDDLLEPDTRILVNLGYGGITQGWNGGPANVVSAADYHGPDMNRSQVLTALDKGAEAGCAAFLADLANPATYQIEKMVDSPAFTELISAAYAAGVINSLQTASIESVLEARDNVFQAPPCLT